MFMVVTVSDCRQLQVQYWCDNKCVYKRKSGFLQNKQATCVFVW